MGLEKTGNLQSVYLLQQNQRIYMNRLEQSLENIGRNMDALSLTQNKLAGELQECANRSRQIIWRLERKAASNKCSENDESELKIFSKARMKSLLRSLHELYDISCLAADAVHGFARNNQYMADMLGLSVLTLKHFLWRERIFMAVILRQCNAYAPNSALAVDCSPVGFCDDKNSYTHLPEYHSLRNIHFHYNELMNEIIEKYNNGVNFSELSVELTKQEQMNEQIMGCIDQLQCHVELLLQGNFK